MMKGGGGEGEREREVRRNKRGNQEKRGREKCSIGFEPYQVDQTTKWYQILLRIRIVNPCR